MTYNDNEGGKGLLERTRTPTRVCVCVHCVAHLTGHTHTNTQVYCCHLWPFVPLRTTIPSAWDMSQPSLTKIRDIVTSFNLFICDLGHEIATFFVSPSTIFKLMHLNWKYFSSILPNPNPNLNPNPNRNPNPILSY